MIVKTFTPWLNSCSVSPASLSFVHSAHNRGWRRLARWLLICCCSSATFCLLLVWLPWGTEREEKALNPRSGFLFCLHVQGAFEEETIPSGDSWVSSRCLTLYALKQDIDTLNRAVRHTHIAFPLLRRSWGQWGSGEAELQAFSFSC